MRDDTGEILLAIADIAMIVDVEILAHRRVEHELFDGEHRTYDLAFLRTGSGRDRKHERVAKRCKRSIEHGVRAAITRTGQRDVMRLVHDDEADTSAMCETLGMYGEKLRCGEYAVDAAICQARIGLPARFIATLARQDRDDEAELCEGLLQMESLVGNEGA